MSPLARPTLRKILVISELEDEISEKFASSIFEHKLNQFTNFPCVVQIVTHMGRGYELTRRQVFDIIVVPQSIQRPFGITELDKCIYTADGVRANFVCMLDYEEDAQPIDAAMKCKFVRNTIDEEPPYKEIKDAIESLIYGEVQVEVPAALPLAQVANTSSSNLPSPVAAATLVRAPKRALPQATKVPTTSITRSSRQPGHVAQSTPSYYPPISYGSYPVVYPLGMGSFGPASMMMHPEHALEPEECTWEEMQRQSILALRQRVQQPPYCPPPPPHSAFAGPPGVWQPAVPGAAPQQRQMHPAALGVQRDQRCQPSGSTMVASNPPCPVSPTPKARKRRFTRPRTPTITYGPPMHSAAPVTAVHQQQSPVRSPHMHRQAAEVGQVNTPERSPPPQQVVVHGHIVREDPLESSEDDMLQNTRRLNTRSPGQVIDPELLDSFLHEDH